MIRLRVNTTNSVRSPRRGTLAMMAAALLLQFVATSRLAAQGPEVIVELSQDQIYEGETTRYRILLNHVEQPVDPDLSAFDEFDVRPAGRQQVNSSKISIINGRRREVVMRGTVYEYELTPKRSGELPIPPPIVMVDGKQLPARSLTLTVVPAPEQDIAVLEMTSSRETVYPMQPFDVSLKILVKPIPEPASERDPLSVQNPLVQLTLPWADDETLAAGLQPKIPAERWLSSMRSPSGFAINGRKSNRSPFSGLGGVLGGGSGFSGGGLGGFFDDLPAGYQPMPTRLRRADANGRRLEYWEYTFTRTFVAEKRGEYSFGPAAVKGVFGVRVDTRGQLEGEPVYAFAKPVTVRVKDVPTAGRPDSYTGAVGRFEIGADLSPRKARVGDPITLTLWLRGVGTLDQILAPKLASDERFTQHFKVYEATEETRGDSRLFTYSLRPKRVATSEVPPIPISYFDVDQEAFVTLHTEPIPISLTEADRMQSGEIAMAVPQRAEQSGMEVRTEGIFANVTDLRQLRDESVHPQRWFLSLGGLAALFFAVALATQRVQRLRSDTSLQRRRGAAADARRRLQSAAGELASGNSRRGAEGISDALIGLVADATNTPHGVLTSNDAIGKLRELGINGEVITRVREVIQSCDDARYGAASGSMSDLAARAEDALDRLARAMKGQRLLS